MGNHYKITKTINNNVSFSVDEKGKEIIIFGKAIGFGKKAGDLVEKNQVQKTFVLQDDRQRAMIMGMVEGLSPEYIDLAGKIIHLLETELDCKLNDMIYLSLSDHIANAVENMQEGIVAPFDILDEIKHIYAREYQVAKKGLDIIAAETGIQLDEREAGFIVLHFLNCQGKTQSNDAAKRVKVQNSIIYLIEQYFQVELDRDSFFFTRFRAHLNYFCSRVFSGKAEPEGDEFIFQTVTEQYPQLRDCVEKIAERLWNKYQIRIFNEEKGYLALHINNLLKKAIIKKEEP